jgi:hypothetical protein
MISLHVKLSRSKNVNVQTPGRNEFCSAYRPHLSKIDNYYTHDFFTRQAPKVEDRRRASIKGFAEKWGIIK